MTDPVMDFVRSELKTPEDLDRARAALAKIPEGRRTEGQIRLGRILEGSLLPDGINAIAQGVTLNTSDESIGALRGAFGDMSVRDAMAAEKLGVQDFRDRSPLSAFVYEMLGSFAPSVLSGGGTLPVQIGKGAVSGGIAAFGDADGGMGQRLTAAPVGASLGAVAGAGAAGLNKVGSAIYAPMQNAAGGTSRTADRIAGDVLTDAFEADGYTGQDMLRLLGERGSRPTIMADYGANLLGLTDAIRQLPGKTRSQIADLARAREQGRVGRIKLDLGENLEGVDTFSALLAETNNRMKTLGSRLYDQAYNVDGQPRILRTNRAYNGKTLQELGQSKFFQDAAKEAASILEGRGLDPAQYGLILDDGVFKLGDEISAQTLHYIKIGLDDLYGSAKSFTSDMAGKRTQIRDLTRFKNELLGWFDEAVPQYKVARNAWAEEAAVLDAASDGRQLFSRRQTKNVDVEEIAEDMKTWGESQKRAFRIGAVQGMVDVMEETADGRNLAQVLVGTPSRRKLIEMTFDDPDKAKAFLRNMELEAKIKQTNNAFLGSQTMPRQEFLKAIRDAVAKKTGSDLQRTFTDTVWNVISREIGEGKASVDEQILRKVAERLGEVLAETNPQVAIDRLFALQTPRGREMLRNMGLDALPKMFTGLLGPVQLGRLVGSATGEQVEQKDLDALRAIRSIR